MKYTIERAKAFYLADIKIDALFLTEYMSFAPGEYIKAYLLGKMYAELGMETDDKKFAGQLGISEQELLGAWEYWEKQGVIKKRYIEENGILDFSVEFINLKEKMLNIEQPEKEHEPDQTIQVFGNQAIKEMFVAIENILGKTLNPKNMESILYLIEDKKALPELIVFAVEYSANRDKKNLRYAEKVVESWLEKGIKTKEEAIEHLDENDSKYYKYKSVMASLGFNRAPSTFEMQMMDHWFDDLGYSVERVLEACAKTTGISAPNFNYVDKIIQSWASEEGSKNGPKEKIVATQGILNKYLDHIRTLAKEEADARKVHVYGMLPELAEIDKEIKKQYVARIKLGVNGDPARKESILDTIDRLKAEKKRLLNSIGREEGYLEPVHKCDICGDTCETHEGACSCKAARMEEAAEWYRDKQ